MLGGLLRARSRFPQIVENIEKEKQGKEFLEHPNALAKQVRRCCATQLRSERWLF
jgi:hypothetical protein